MARTPGPYHETTIEPNQGGGGGAPYILAIGNSILGSTPGFMLIVDVGGNLFQQAIPAAGGNPAPPINAIQYNNPLGTFGADAGATRVALTEVTNIERTAGSPGLIQSFQLIDFLGTFPAAGLINDDGIGQSRVIVGDVTAIGLSPFTVNLGSTAGGADSSDVILQPTVYHAECLNANDIWAADVFATNINLNASISTIAGGAVLSVLDINANAAIPRYQLDMSNATQQNAVLRQHSLFNTLPAVPGQWDLIGLQTTATIINAFLFTNITYGITGSINWIGSGVQSLTSGSNNTTFGFGSGSLISSGSNNTCVGRTSASALATGNRVTTLGSTVRTSATTADSTIVGYLSGSPTLTGIFTTICGDQSGGSMITSEASSIFGSHAGQNLTTGGGQLFAGYLCGNSIVVGLQNVLLGNQVGSGNVAFDFSFATIAGFQAGQNNSGDEVVFAGYRAGQNNTADGTIAIGNLAARNFTTASASPILIAIGDQAGLSLTGTGTDNTIVGHGSVRDGANVSRVVTLGHSAGEDLASNDCVLIGYFAGRLLDTNSDSNVIVGTQAGSNIVQSIDNTIIGCTSAQSTTNANSNVIIGCDAMQSAVDNGGFAITQNVIIGNDAVFSALTHGVQNVLIGNDCARVFTGSETVAIGHQALLVATSSAISNTVIGWKAGAGLSGDRNVLIGHDLSSTTDSNDCVFIGADQNLFATSGDRLVLIGSQALSTSSTWDDSIGLGVGASVNGSNQFVVGSTSSNITDYWLGRGQEAAISSDITIQPTRGIGTNTNGGDLILKGGGPTGSGNGGNFEVWTATAGASGTTQRLPTVRLTVDQNSNIRATGLHDNATTQGSATQQDIRSGTYTPTGTVVANADSVTPFQFQWHRTGNFVHFSGKIDVDPTAAATLTQVRLSLPVVSNLAAEQDLAGHCDGYAAELGARGPVYADAGNNEALVNFVSIGTASGSFIVSGSYEVL